MSSQPHCRLQDVRTEDGSLIDSAPSITEMHPVEASVCWVLGDKGLAEGDTMQDIKQHLC